MSGNVDEWCWDYYNSASMIDGSTPVTGPATCNQTMVTGIRRMRGGLATGLSLDASGYYTVFARGSGGPQVKFNTNGFRLAHSGE